MNGCWPFATRVREPAAREPYLVIYSYLSEKSIEENRNYRKILWYKTEDYGIIWNENIL